MSSPAEGAVGSSGNPVKLGTARPALALDRWHGLRSWRTGAYRIVESRIEILVVAPGHRREIYDRLGDRLR